MTKSKFITIARNCGYDAEYCGKKRIFYLHALLPRKKWYLETLPNPSESFKFIIQ